MRIVQVGYIQDDDVRIYIQDTIHEQLLAFAKEDITHERGTFLIGNNANEGGTLSTYITGFIEARYTEATATSLTFTHETWNYVHRELAANYPNKKIYLNHIKSLILFLLPFLFLLKIFYLQIQAILVHIYPL